MCVASQLMPWLVLALYIVQYLLSDMTFASNLSFLLDGIDSDWLHERIMSTDLPLPPAATASSDMIVREVRCKMYIGVQVEVVIVCRNIEYPIFIIIIIIIII